MWGPECFDFGYYEANNKLELDASQASTEQLWHHFVDVGQFKDLNFRHGSHTQPAICCMMYDAYVRVTCIRKTHHVPLMRTHAFEPGRAPY